jgi:hypothetical protein
MFRRFSKHTRTSVLLSLKLLRFDAVEARRVQEKLMSKANKLVPPSRRLLLAEARAVYELAAFLWAYPWLRLLPAGDGHPVMVFPGLAASDVSTVPLRTFLSDRGYAAHGWDLGRNRGLKPGLNEFKLDRLRELRRRHGRKVSLIGWSLGGIFARELAKRAPEDVRQVITLGSPVKGSPRATHAAWLYEMLSGHSVYAAKSGSQLHLPPPVPTTAIFSRSDGIVAWQCCVEDERTHTESVEVWASHCGLGHNPAALYVIADRLGQKEGSWAPFDRGGLRSLVFPDPRRGTAQED